MIKHGFSLIQVATISTLALLAFSCGKSDDGADASSNETMSEIAGSAVAGAASSTDGGGMSSNESRHSTSFAFLESLAPVSIAEASTQCPTILTSSCSAASSTGVITLSYNSCNFGSSAAVWNGTQYITFSAGTCSTATPVSAGNTFKRTFAAGTTRQGANGVTVTLNTVNPTGYDGFSASGGMTMAVSAGPSRAMTINGIEYTAQKTNAKGVTKTVWDHTVSGTGTITGTGASRQVTALNLTVRHNLAKYSGNVTLSAPLTFTSGCCHPTGGSISTAVSGSITGTETLTYGSSCGSATLVDTSGNSSSITLNHCL